MNNSNSFRTFSAYRTSSAEMRDTSKALKRITTIFSLHCTVPKTRWQMFLMLFKALVSAAVLGFLNLYTMYIKIRDYYKDINLSIKLTDTIQTCYDYSQYLVDLYFVFKYGREMFVEYNNQFGNIDQVLSITDNSPVKRRFHSFIGYFAVVWVVTSVCDFSAWSLSYGAYLPTIYSPSYLFLLLKIFNTLDLMSHVMHIEFRLKCIVDQLQDCYCSAKPLPGVFKDPVCNKYWFYFEGSSNDTKLETQSARITPVTTKNHQAVKWLSRCYLRLVEQCVFINKMYGIRILLNSLSLLIDMIRFTNIAVRLISGSQPTLYAPGYYPAAGNLVRVGTCALIVGTLVAQCERVYRRRDAALAVIDHTLVNKDPDAALKSALNELRGLLQSRPVEFHTAYFFRLDYAFLVSLVSVMVTYTIILIQSLPN